MQILLHSFMKTEETKPKHCLQHVTDEDYISYKKWKAITIALFNEIARLEKLHDQIASYAGAKNAFVLDGVRDEINLLKDCLPAINNKYESQFPKSNK